MRPIPVTRVTEEFNAGSDQLADWVEDYVLDTLTDTHPNTVFSVRVDRAEGYYDATILSSNPGLIGELEKEAADITSALEELGVKSTIYVGKMANPVPAAASN